MTLLAVLGILNYGRVLIYGLLLSVFVAGGWKDKKQNGLAFALCPLFLLIQLLGWLLLGETAVRQLYPLIVHLPLVLILIFALKKPVGLAVVSVLTAYVCCQIPRWGSIAVETLTRSALVGEIVYTLCIGPVFYVLMRWFVEPAHRSATFSTQSLVLFGSLPAIYYVFDYATTIYSDSLYAGIPALNELVPTVAILFYVVFLMAYHHETQKRIQVELEISARDVLLTQARKEMDALHKMQEQTAIYQHDMRHHLNMVDSFLAAGKQEQAMAYIRKAQNDMTSLSVTQFCGNDTVNLICSSYLERFRRMGVRLSVQAKLPEALGISDTELCVILSNALENALNATEMLEENRRWVELYCEAKRDKLLIQVKNPYDGIIALEDGLPVSIKPGHGFGCRSIRAIVEQHNGLYTFSPEKGVFTLQVMLPILPVETEKKP